MSKFFAGLKVLAGLILLPVIINSLFPIYAQYYSSPSGARVITPVEIKKDNLQQRIADFQAKQASKSAVLKAKLQSFQDQRRAQIAQKISDNLNRVNQNQTSQMNQVLTKLGSIIDRAEKIASSSSIATASVSAQIANSRTAIAGAKAAVSAQSLNDYTVNATAEATLKNDIKTQRDKLFVDLKSVRDLTMTARQSVVNVVKFILANQKGASPPAKY